MALVSEIELIQKLKQGEVISFPTDTVAALAALPDFSGAIYQIKRRSLDKPLILLASKFADFESYIAGTAEEKIIWQNMASLYWPGPLTLILPASEQLPSSIKAPTIGLRVPNHPGALNILSQSGPLATTSANLSGEPPLSTMREVAQNFPSVFVLEQDFSLATGVPSTIIKWIGATRQWQVLRQGLLDIINK
jgi:L-threonylcarbamoyladenylate synthase